MNVNHQLFHVNQFQSLDDYWLILVVGHILVVRLYDYYDTNILSFLDVNLLQNVHVLNSK